MNKLIEIAEVVKTVKISSADFLNTKKTSQSKTQKLYYGLLTGKFKTDQAAAKSIFNENSTSYNYKNLKRYLRQKMLNTVFFVEPKKSYGEFNAVYIFCCKNFFIAKILLNLGARVSGIDLCQKVFRRAQEVELTEFLVESSRYLRLHHGSRNGDLKMFEFYHEVFVTQSKILEAERLAEEYYIRITLPLVRTVNVSQENIDNAEKFIQELEPLMEQYQSPVLYFYGYYLKILFAQFINDYQMLIEECQKAISFFELKDYTYANPLRVFYHNLLVGYTQLKEYQAGKLAAEKSAQLVLSGTHSWYVHKELHLILAFHSKELEEAYKIIEEALNHKKFKLLDAVTKEKWSLYKAYIHFFALLGEVDVPNKGVLTFRMGRFLNNIPIFSKDKRGLNIPILIIQIVFMIIQKDYNRSIDRFEAIKKYVSRHVNKGDNYRSHYFINMLLALPENSFHKVAVLRRTEDWYKKLLSRPLKVANQGHEIEIIPYEDLWAYILDSLDS